MSRFDGGSDSHDWSAAFSHEDDEDDDGPSLESKEYKSKDAVLFLVDCNPSIHEVDEQGLSAFEKIIRVMADMLKVKIISSPLDQVAVVLYNTRIKKNENDFKGVNVFMPLQEVSAAKIKMVEALMNMEYFEENVGSSNDCEFYTALWIASSIFTNSALKDATQRVFIITNQDNPNGGDIGLRDKAIQKADDMQDLNITLQLFALNPEGGHFEHGKYWKDVMIVDATEEDSRADVFRTYTTLQEMNDGFKKKNIKKRALASVNLEIGPGVAVAVKLYVLARMAVREQGGWLDSKTNEPLHTMTQWICQDTGSLLEPYQINKYHMYGGAKVFFKQEEMVEIKTFGDPGLTLLGFKPMNRLKVYHNLKPPYFLFPDEQTVKGSTVAFNALVTEMSAMGVFAVCRMIYRKSQGPRFVAMVPQREVLDSEGRQLTPQGMNMIFLPFADDIRNIQHEPTPIAEPELVKSVKEMVLKLKISKEAEPQERPFDNPVLQQHYRVLQALALDEDLEAEEQEDGSFMPDYEGFAKFTPLLERISKDCFEVETPEELEMNALYESRKRKGGGGGGGGAKRVRTAEELGDVNQYDWQQLAESGDLSKLTMDQLKLYLRANKLRLSGKKGELVARVEEHLVDAGGAARARNPPH